MTKSDKAAYDRKYRAKNRELLKIQKAAWFQRTYDPAKAATERKKRMPQHVEYCRQPKYKAWKRAYDKERRSKKFGPFAEAHQLLVELKREINRQMPDRFERYAQAQRHQYNPVNQARRRQKRGNATFDSDGL